MREAMAPESFGQLKIAVIYHYIPLTVLRSEGYTIDNKYYYVTGMGNSNLTNETLRIESIKRY